MPGGLQFTIDQTQLRDVARILRKEEDGKLLRKDLVNEIKTILEPLRDEVRSSILEMTAGGLPHEGDPLRQAIAKRVVVEVRTGGRATGASIKAKRRGMPRGFEHAAKRTNRQKWRHPVFRRVTKNGVEVDVWVNQVGKPRWFDDPISARKGHFRIQVLDAIRAMKRRIQLRH